MSEEKSVSFFKKLPRLQVEGAMADHPEGYQAPPTFADRFFGFNPFTHDDPRHELWETNARYAVEEDERLRAERLKRLPAEPANPEEFVVWIVDGSAEHFDILAKRALIFTAESAQSVVLYEQFLALIAESIVTRVRENCPSSLPRKLLLTELRLRFRQRKAHWTAEALKRARDTEKRVGASKAPPSLKSWKDLGISFLSDERVQIIRNGASAETLNYAEMGFKDRRNGKPNRAWVTLRLLAEERGIIRDPAKTGGAWQKVERRMQEIRKVLRPQFGIHTDPVPFVKGTGCQALFKIDCAPSFRT